MAEPTAHSTELYILGKGVLKFDRFDTAGLPTGLRDIGNAPVFNLTPTVEVIKHYSEREGIQKKDLEVDKLTELNGDFELDEFDRENLRMYLRGSVGSWDIAPMTSGNIIGTLDFVGNNDQGPNYHYNAKVKLTAKGSLGFISDDWGRYGFTFSVQDNAANEPNFPYGKLTLLGES
jgi:hypothetical protein